MPSLEYIEVPWSQCCGSGIRCLFDLAIRNRFFPDLGSQIQNYSFEQCSGSMKFWGGSESGSADPCLWLVDPDPAIFFIDLQDASKKLIFNTSFSAYYFLKVHLYHFSKIKSQKEPQNSRNQGFSYYFRMMIEGSGSRSGSGSIPLTSGSGSGRPKTCGSGFGSGSGTLVLTG